MLDQWMSITMMIDAEGGDTGTGFLIRYTHYPDASHSPVKWFVVTNKHVVGDRRHELRNVTLYSRIGPFGQKKREMLDIPLQNPDGVQIVFDHPSPDVDVLAIDVTAQIISNTLIEHDAPGIDAFYLPPETDPSVPHVGVGAPVCIIGYPDLDRGSGTTAQFYNEHIVFGGSIATSLDRPYVEDYKERRGFLINATAVPGHSGSPVVLDPKEPLVIDGRHYLGQHTAPYLLGILTESRFARVKAERFEQYALAGAAFVYSARTIVETVRQAMR